MYIWLMYLVDMSTQQIFSFARKLRAKFSSRTVIPSELEELFILIGNCWENVKVSGLSWKRRWTEVFYSWMRASTPSVFERRTELDRQKMTCKPVWMWQQAILARVGTCRCRTLPVTQPAWHSSCNEREFIYLFIVYTVWPFKGT